STGVLVDSATASRLFAGVVNVDHGAAQFVSDLARCLDQSLLGVVHPALANAERNSRIDKHDRWHDDLSSQNESIHVTARIKYVPYNVGELEALARHVRDDDVGPYATHLVLAEAHL